LPNEEKKLNKINNEEINYNNNDDEKGKGNGVKIEMKRRN